eukprot:scaffold119757_cov24-Tisochrysis_lutea.AAC.1
MEENKEGLSATSKYGVCNWGQPSPRGFQLVCNGMLAILVKCEGSCMGSSRLVTNICKQRGWHRSV